MPKYIANIYSYDPLVYFTRLELRRMYQAEGYSTKEATRMARVLYEEIRNLNRYENYSWSRARDLEEPVGGIKELEYLAAPLLITYADDLWILIQSMAMPDEREVAHYERLKGHRLRFSPAVKESRERGRAEELRLAEEIERKRRLEQLWRRADELREISRRRREAEAAVAQAAGP
jgi:hypothetical protein